MVIPRPRQARLIVFKACTCCWKGRQHRCLLSQPGTNETAKWQHYDMHHAEWNERKAIKTLRERMLTLNVGIHQGIWGYPRGSVKSSRKQSTNLVIRTGNIADIVFFIAVMSLEFYSLHVFCFFLSFFSRQHVLTLTATINQIYGKPMLKKSITSTVQLIKRI